MIINYRKIYIEGVYFYGTQYNIVNIPEVFNLGLK